MQNSLKMPTSKNASSRIFNSFFRLVEILWLALFSCFSWKQADLCWIFKACWDLPHSVRCHIIFRYLLSEGIHLFSENDRFWTPKTPFWKNKCVEGAGAATTTPSFFVKRLLGKQIRGSLLSSNRDGLFGLVESERCILQVLLPVYEHNSLQCLAKRHTDYWFTKSSGNPPLLDTA